MNRSTVTVLLNSKFPTTFSYGSSRPPHKKRQPCFGNKVAVGFTFTLILFLFSIIRGLNSSQSRIAKRSVSSSSKASKRCGGIENGGVNPCGGCQDSSSDYSIAGVATLRARDFDCSAHSPCFGGQGWCQKLSRTVYLIVRHGDLAVSKTLEVPVACICARFVAK